MTKHRNRMLPFLVAVGSLALTMAAPAVGQSQATVHGHTLESVAVLTDPNAMNDGWQTPLMAAAFNADQKALKNLIARKANINVGDRFGMTALMYARLLPTVKMLLDAGASVNDKDITGKTALYYAAQRADPDVVNALIKADANVNARDDKGMSALHLAKMELPAKNFDKSLREAYQTRVQKVIDLLVGAGASEDHP